MTDKKHLEPTAQVHGFSELEFINHLQERIIVLNDEINDELIEKVILQILKWNRQDKDIPVDEREKIEILLNTPGGAVDVGMVLCNVIQKSETPIIITGLAIVASMGSYILMSGHKRRAYEYTNILIHDGSMFLGGTANKVKDHIKYQEEKDQQLNNLVVSRTKITEDKLDEMSDREWWMTAKTALELGIIDEII